MSRAGMLRELLSSISDTGVRGSVHRGNQSPPTTIGQESWPLIERYSVQVMRYIHLTTFLNLSRMICVFSFLDRSLSRLVSSTTAT
jgi:hypothetical protein